jgi:DNA-binding beta-propeller fold protein YncE
MKKIASTRIMRTLFKNLFISVNLFEICLLLTATAFVALLNAGCSAKWIMDVKSAQELVQWPPAPGEEKVRYSMMINGFREVGVSAGSLLFGKGEQKLMRPVALAKGLDGRIAVADTGCRCVHLYVPTEQQYHKITAGEGDLLSPVGVAFDDALRLYVADSVLAKVFVFDALGDYLFSIEKTGDGVLKRPTGLAFDSRRKVLYVADTLSHGVHAFDSKGSFLFSFGERGTEKGQFNFPTHIFWSDAGNLYVTDSMNFRVQIFDSSGTFLSLLGRQGDGSGDFAIPKGVASGRDRIIYVVDSLFDTVQLFDERGEFLLAVGGRGTGPGEFWLPSGIFLDDNNGMLYVCDTFNQRVQVFRISGRPALATNQ